MEKRNKSMKIYYPGKNLIKTVQKPTQVNRYVKY